MIAWRSCPGSVSQRRIPGPDALTGERCGRQVVRPTPPRRVAGSQVRLDETCELRWVTTTFASSRLARSSTDPDGEHDAEGATEPAASASGQRRLRLAASRQSPLGDLARQERAARWRLAGLASKLLQRVAVLPELDGQGWKTQRAKQLLIRVGAGLLMSDQGCVRCGSIRALRQVGPRDVRTIRAPRRR